MGESERTLFAFALRGKLWSARFPVLNQRQILFVYQIVAAFLLCRQLPRLDERANAPRCDAQAISSLYSGQRFHVSLYTIKLFPTGLDLCIPLAV